MAATRANPGALGRTRTSYSAPAPGRPASQGPRREQKTLNTPQARLGSRSARHSGSARGHERSLKEMPAASRLHATQWQYSREACGWQADGREWPAPPLPTVRQRDYGRTGRISPPALSTGNRACSAARAAVISPASRRSSIGSSAARSCFSNGSLPRLKSS